MRKGKESVIVNVGVDNNYSQNDLIYFNITGYEPIKSDIESGIEKNFAGNSQYDTKARRDFSATGLQA